MDLKTAILGCGMLAGMIHVDGRAATAGELGHPAAVNYGHYTTMQLRGGATRGLGLHLARLAAAHAELFGTGLDLGRVRSVLRTVAAVRPDAQLRVQVFEAAPGEPTVLTVLRPPTAPAAEPLTLLPVPYARPVAHIKHVGSFAQTYHARRARAAGFSDALLVAPDGRLTETSVANLGFLTGATVVWPDAPALQGTTRQLVDLAAPSFGLTITSAPVTLDSLPAYPVAFVANSAGLAPVARIGDHRFAPGPGRLPDLVSALESHPWDAL